MSSRAKPGAEERWSESLKQGSWAAREGPLQALNVFQVTNKKPITVLEILQKIRMHVSVPQCDVFGYLSIESEIVILIIPVDHYPKALQVRVPHTAAVLSLYSGRRGHQAGLGRD